MHVLFAGRIKFEPNGAILVLVDIEDKILRGNLHDTYLLIGHEILCEALLLVRHEPREVGLVLCEHACHKLDIRTVVVGEIAVPSPSEVTIAPCPLLLTRRDMVAGHVEHTAMRVILIAAFKVVFRVDTHIGCRHLDVLIVGDVHTCGVVHLVIGACSDRERTDGTLAVVEDGVDVLREDALIIVVDSHGRVGPPQEGLRQRCAIIKVASDFKVSLTGTKRKACGSFLMEHTLIFVDPHGHGAVGVLFDRSVHGQKGGRAVVLRPVKLDAATDPGARQSHESRLDDMIVVDEVTTLHLVVGHLYAATEFRQHHHFDVFVLDIYGVPGVSYRLITDLLDDGIWIYHATGALVDSFLKIHRVLVGLPDLISRDDDVLFPCFYHDNV